MAKSVKDIGRNKWLKLSTRQKHTAICRYARECLADSANYNSFLEFYRQVRDWSRIDIYTPPDWLNDHENLENYFNFHLQFSERTYGYFQKTETPVRVEWKPHVEVSVVCDYVITPFNLGAILRVMDNFGLKELIYHNPHLDINHSNLKRSARGVQTWIPIRHEDNLYDFLKNAQNPVIGLEKTDGSESLEGWIPLQGPFYLVVGNEVYGISEKILTVCDQVIQIPMYGNKHSMNLSHALAVAAYHINTYKK